MPLVIMSAGLLLVKTCIHCIGLVRSIICATLLATNTLSDLDVLIQDSTIVESDQSIMFEEFTITFTLANLSTTL